MSLTLYMHPLASYCWKVLIALYENETPFRSQIVDLSDRESRESFEKVWPMAKFPVLRDEGNQRTIPESTIIIEYLAAEFPGRTELVPKNPRLALDARIRDRFFDLYVHEPMQKIVTDKLRPKDKMDSFGVELARAQLAKSYATLDDDLKMKRWAIGDVFSIADCAAGPALHYANRVQPFMKTHPNLATYLTRLEDRPSFARVLVEATPYFKHFPG